MNVPAIGIDHGTSNSAIAVMEPDGPRIIKPDGVADVMPSKVYYFANGQRRLVGTPAYNAALLNKPSEGGTHGPYKPTIGNDLVYEFPGGKRHTGVELGAIILGRLLRAYEEEGGSRPTAAVVTVPAMFNQADASATREAAQRAGLESCELLAEPVAAALAHGFGPVAESTRWMVFDLGGGTLDVSLVMVRDGELEVPKDGHDGDNNLGGQRFDELLLEHVVGAVREQYAVGDFGPKSSKYGHAYTILGAKVETAKIELSTRDTALISVDLDCEDDRGRAIQVEVEVSRTTYESMIAADVERALQVCRRLMAKAELSPRDVARLVLVGGPTKTPYIRRRLGSELGIPIDDRIDPMTAVARGAAIHAVSALGGTAGVVQRAEVGASLDIELTHPSKSAEATVPVAIQVRTHGRPLTGLKASISRSDGAWADEVALDENGEAEIELALIPSTKPRENRFVTRIFDERDQLQGSTEGPLIWYPLQGAPARLPASIRVALHDGSSAVLVDKGTSLPTAGGGRFFTTVDLRPGSGGDVLRIPVIEGVNTLFGDEDEAADTCMEVGTLVIHGGDDRIRRFLPSGSAVEVEVEVDSSRQTTVRAYVPGLDEEFEEVIDYRTKLWSPGEGQKRLEEARRRLTSIEAVQQRAPVVRVSSVLQDIEKMEAVASIDTEWAEAAKSAASHARADRRLRELLGTLNRTETIQALARARVLMMDLSTLQTPEKASLYRELQGELKARPEDEDPNLGPSLLERVAGLESDLRARYIHQLLLDIVAFPQTFRGTKEQIEAFERGETHVMRALDDRRLYRPISASRLQEIRAAHDRLSSLWPELSQWRAEARAHGRMLSVDDDSTILATLRRG